MKFLVTGASGFIGKHIVNCLLERKHEVCILLRNQNVPTRSKWPTSISTVFHDIGDDCADLYSRCNEPDILIHSAWGNLDDYNSNTHKEILPQQHLGFISALVDAGLQQCAVLGTCLEYGLHEGALDEDMQCTPILAYPQGKNLLHNNLIELQQNKNFTLRWLRLFYMYGPGQRGSSLLALVDSALEQHMESFDMSPGDQLRDYLPVEVVANYICRIAEACEFDGTVNCCSGLPQSVLQLVQEHLKLRDAKLKLNTGVYSYPTYEPKNFWGNTERLNSLLKNHP